MLNSIKYLVNDKINLNMPKLYFVESIIESCMFMFGKHPK